MVTEQPGREEAIAYQYQRTIKSFHRKLRRIYHFIKAQCEDFGGGGCGETPKLICFRSLREFPPIQCPLYDKGYFPLVVDQKFAKDIAIIEMDDLRLPKRLTNKHGRRFIRMLGSNKFHLIRKNLPDDPSETILSM